MIREKNLLDVKANVMREATADDDAFPQLSFVCPIFVPVVVGWRERKRDRTDPPTANLKNLSSLQTSSLPLRQTTK